MTTIYEPPPPEPTRREQAWDAINVILGAWGLYALLAAWVQRRRK